MEEAPGQGARGGSLGPIHPQAAVWGDMELGTRALPPPRWQIGSDPAPVGNRGPQRGMAQGDGAGVSPVLSKGRTCPRRPVLAPASTQGCCGAGSRSQVGAVQGFPCTREVSLRLQQSILGARWPGLSTQQPAPSSQHQPGAGGQHIPRTTTLPTPFLQPTQQQIPAAIGSPRPFSPFPGCAPQPTLTNPSSALFFPLFNPAPCPRSTVPGGRAVPSLEQQNTFCKCQRGQSSSPPKREDARDGAESQ